MSKRLRSSDGPKRPRAPAGQDGIPVWGAFASSYLYLDGTLDANPGVRGRDGAWHVGVVFWLDRAPTGSEYLVECGSTIATGWNLRTGPASCVLRVLDGVAAAIQASSSNAGAFNGQKGWHAVLAGNDGAGNIWCTVDADIVRNSAIVGYTSPGAADFVIGRRNNGANTLDDGRIATVGGSDSVSLSAAEVAAWFAAVKSGLQRGSLAGLPNDCEHEWIAHPLTNYGSASPAPSLREPVTPTVPRTWRPRRPIHW